MIIIDFHAKATSEKIAFAHYLDGQASAIIGTHTHVQTADARMVPGGTAYVADVGMTGPYHSVIGIEVGQIIERFLTLMPRKYDVAGGKGIISAADTHCLGLYFDLFWLHWSTQGAALLRDRTSGLESAGRCGGGDR